MPKIRIYNYSMITKEKETLKETRDNREATTSLSEWSYEKKSANTLSYKFRTQKGKKVKI